MSLFYSHSHANKPRVVEIKRLLDRAGFSGWIDSEQTVGGDSLERKIALGIDACAIFLAFVSASYLSSAACNKELQIAAGYGIKCIFILFRDVPSFPPRVGAGTFAADMVGHMAGKKYVRDEAEMEILRAVREQMGTASSGGGSTALPAPLPPHAAAAGGAGGGGGAGEVRGGKGAEGVESAVSVGSGGDGFSKTEPSAIVEFIRGHLRDAEDLRRGLATIRSGPRPHGWTEAHQRSFRAAGAFSVLAEALRSHSSDQYWVTDITRTMTSLITCCGEDRQEAMLAASDAGVIPLLVSSIRSHYTETNFKAHAAEACKTLHCCMDILKYRGTVHYHVPACAEDALTHGAVPLLVGVLRHHGKWRNTVEYSCGSLLCIARHSEGGKAAVLAAGTIEQLAETLRLNFYSRDGRRDAGDATVRAVREFYGVWHPLPDSFAIHIVPLLIPLASPGSAFGYGGSGDENCIRALADMGYTPTGCPKK